MSLLFLSHDNLQKLGQIPRERQGVEKPKRQKSLKVEKPKGLTGLQKFVFQYH